MNKNLNLVEILKDCPKGTKLYSPIFGEVKFEEINDYNKKGKFTIVVYAFNLHLFANFTKEGFYFEGTGECTLFPSKEQRDWSKFKPIYEFKDGDILSYKNARLSHRTIYIYRYHKRFNTSYYVALSFDPKKSLMISNKGGLVLNAYDSTVRFATEEEKQKLFKAIKDNGYEWNAETKTLEKLVKPKFDPKTLQPFDKVLARDLDTNFGWYCLLFSHYKNEDKYPCVCVGEAFNVCIPYNEDTKHLVGTTKEAPEYYRYWED